MTPEGLASSETCRLLSELHTAAPGGPPPPPTPELDEHLRWVEAQGGCVGTSDHGLLFSAKQEAGGEGHGGGGAWGPGALLDAAAQLLVRSGRGAGQRGGAGGSKG